MKRLPAVFLLLAVVGSTVLAQDPPGSDARMAKRDDIRQLLKASGQEQIAQVTLDRLLRSHEQAFPQVPEAFWVTFKEEADLAAMLERLVDVYDKYLSHEDIKELTRFYRSPVGKRLLKAQPHLNAEALKIGETWGREVSKRVLEQLREKGYR